MARTFAEIDDALAAWIAAQKVFFVASAPLAADGHVNVSPKGLAGTFTVLDPTTVAYLDLTGSGIETAAHVQENGRITLMWCAFEGPPRIVRVHGRAEVIWPSDGRFPDLAARFPALPGVRAVIVVGAERVSDSCGYGVPFLAYTGERRTFEQWAERKGPDGIAAYQAQKNATSLDGLVGVPVTERSREALP